VRRFGNLHKIVYFAERTLPKRGAGSEVASFTHEVFEFLQSLDGTQAANPWMTFTFQAGGGIWTTWNGERLFYVWPAQQHLRLWMPKTKPSLVSLINSLDKLQRKKPEMEYIDNPADTSRGWYVQPGDLSLISNFLAKMKAPAASALKADDRSHPRFFPGEIRQMALAAFESGGSICPGVDRPKHKLNLDDRIEFDHILPHSRGGSRSLLNVHVLCQSCNNKKRATARGNAVEV
jgi:hypothetical protein